jgi:hypothetical protein
MEHALYYVGDDHQWVACPIIKTTKRHVHIRMPPGSFGWLEPDGVDPAAPYLIRYKHHDHGEMDATIVLATLMAQGSAHAFVRVKVAGKMVRRSREVFNAEGMLLEKAQDAWFGMRISATVSFNKCKGDIIAAAREAGTDPTPEMVLAAIERNGGMVCR